MVRDVLRDVKDGKIIHEGYLRTIGKRISATALEELDCNPASYSKLKNEVIYLRKEVEFLKKSRSRCCLESEASSSGRAISSF